MSDRGAAALAERLHEAEQGWYSLLAADTTTLPRMTHDKYVADWLLGERGVFLPDGLPAESRLRVAAQTVQFCCAREDEFCEGHARLQATLAALRDRP